MAQQEAEQWLLGERAWVSFSSGLPVAKLGSAMVAPMGTASLADANGALLCYTNGQTVWNAQHNVIAQGLLGDSTATQAAVALPRLASPGVVDLFTVAANGDPNGLRHHALDLTANGGAGGMLFQNVALRTPVAEKLTATFHPAGGYWLLAHDWNSTAFVAYPVDSFGSLGVPVVSAVGAFHGNFQANASGAMKISPDGAWVACALPRDGIVELFQFDPGTGSLSFFAQWNDLDGPFGVGFSPNGQWLYITNDAFGTGGELVNSLYQVDLAAGTPGAVILSRQLVGQFSSGLFDPQDIRQGVIQLGPDGKLYVGMEAHTHLGVVEFPDLAGPACNYQRDGLALGGARSGRGLPAFVQSWVQARSVDLAFSDRPCAGQPVSFIGRASPNPDAWAWNFGDGSTSTLQNPTHAFAAGGVYTVQLAVLRGAEWDTASRTLVVVPQPENPFASPVVEACAGDTIRLNAANPGAQYFWNTGASQREIQSLRAGSFTVKVTYQNRCSDVFAVEIVRIVPPVPVLPPDVETCASTYTISASLPAEASFFWEDGSTELARTVTATGAYVLTAEQAGCTAADTQLVTLLPLPDFSEIPAVVTRCTPAEGPFVLAASPTWAFHTWPDGSDNPVYPVRLAGSYTLTATSTAGCVGEHDFVLQDTCVSVVVPTAFSPNGDGQNDLLIWTGTGVKKGVVRIYNRWGDELVVQEGWPIAWDGTIPGGPAPEGVYVWELRLTPANAAQPIRTQRGSITLLR